jgi:hypothetical protein
MAKRALQSGAWGKMTTDALAALNAGDLAPVRQYLDNLISSQAGEWRIWRKTHILADSAVAALKADDMKQLRHFLEALQAVTSGGQ